MRLSPIFARFLPSFACLLFSAPVWSQTASEPAASHSVRALVDEIVAANPELAFYEAEIDAAKAARKAAGTRENLELALSLGRKRVTDVAGVLAGEGTAWTVSLAQPFEWPGRLSLRKAIANRDLTLAELGLSRFKAALASRARSLAWGLYAAQARAETAAEVATRYQALRDLFLSRDPGGITPLLETRAIEAQELALQHRAVEAQLALHAALVELNQLRGRPVESPITVVNASLSLADAPPTDILLAAARENNFEFRAARVELEQQGLRVSLARSEGRPAFTVSPFYSEENAGDRERTYGLGLSLSLPVNGRSGALAAGAEARRRQAEAAVLVAQRTMEREVITAAQRFAAKRAEGAKWAPEAARKFREAAELADRHYRLGAVPLPTYIELQNAYLDAIDAIYGAQQEALEAASELQLLTGLNLVAPEREGNR